MNTRGRNRRIKEERKWQMETKAAINEKYMRDETKERIKYEESAGGSKGRRGGKDGCGRSIGG